jgi:hypothetical protein
MYRAPPSRVLALLTFSVACASTPPGSQYVHVVDPALPPKAKECFSRDAAESYARSIHQRVVDNWHIPRESRANQKVTVRIRIAESGDLVGMVPATSQDRFAESVLRAVRESDPFPRMEGDAKCLSEQTLVVTFSNPEVGR